MMLGKMDEVEEIDNVGGMEYEIRDMRMMYGKM